MIRWYPAGLAAGLVLTVAPLAAQAPPVRRLSLDQALELAVPASEALGLARAGIARASGEVRRVRGDLLPQISGSVSYNRLLKSQFEGFAGEDDGAGEPAPASCSAFTPVPGDPVTQRLDSLERSVRCLSQANPFSNLGTLPFGRANTWNLGLSGSQVLFAGGRILAGIRAAEAGERGAEIALTAAEAQLTLDVVRAYYDAALADRLVAIAQSALNQADTTLVQTRLRREVGTAPEFDLLRAGVARDNLRPALIQAQAQRDLGYQHLRNLLNLPPTTALELAAELGPEGYTSAPILERLMARSADTSASQRATVRQADEAIAAQRALVRVAQGETLPAVSVTSQYGKVAYPSGGIPGWNEFYTNWNVSVGLQVPLFTGGKLRAGRDVARAGLAEATLRRQQAAEAAALDALAARSELEAARSAWIVGTGTVEQAARAYQIAEVRYQEGISTQTELLDARLALQQAEANRAVAARDLIVARVRMALLADLPLAGVSVSPGSAGATSSVRAAPVPAAATSTGTVLP